MNYFEEIDTWLTVILLGGEEGEQSEQWLLRLKKEIKDKILESYRNGQKAGLKPKPSDTDKPEQIRQSKSWPPWSR